MKKVFVFVLALLFLAPWVGLACTCCPAPQTSSSGLPILTSEGCDCCPEPVQIDFKKMNLREILRTLQSPLSASASFVAAIVSISPSRLNLGAGLHSKFYDSGPSAFSQNTPLYLFKGVLRL